MSDDGPQPSTYAPHRAWLAALPKSGTLMRHELDGFPPYEFALMGLDRDITVASFRPHRLGGYSLSDRALQQQLYLIVGAITVASGHAETDMKRILLASDSDKTKHLGDVPSDWSELLRRLRKLAERETDHQDLLELLDWAEEKQVTQIRHDAVHSDWWLYDVGHIHRTRVPRKSPGGEGDHAQVGTLDHYFEQVEVMFRFAERLQVLTHWVVAILPPVDAPGYADQQPRLPMRPNLSGSFVRRDDAPPSGD